MRHLSSAASVVPSLSGASKAVTRLKPAGENPSLLPDERSLTVTPPPPVRTTCLRSAALAVVLFAAAVGGLLGATLPRTSASCDHKNYAC